MENLSKAIGKRIAELRMLHGMTQERLADILNVSPKHVSSVERGLSMFSLEKLVQVCDALDCDMNYLVLGKLSGDDDVYIPDSIKKVLESHNQSDLNLLTEYLLMFSKLRQK